MCTGTEIIFEGDAPGRGSEKNNNNNILASLPRWIFLNSRNPFKPLMAALGYIIILYTFRRASPATMMHRLRITVVSLGLFCKTVAHRLHV